MQQPTSVAGWLPARTSFAPAILELMHEAVVVADAAERIIFCNDGVQRVLGYPAAELVGQSLELLLPKRHRATHRGHVEAFARGGAPFRLMGQRAPVWARHRDGIEIRVEISISRVDIGEELLFAAVVRDLTELDAHRAAHEASEHRYRHLFEQALEGIVEFSARGRLTRANHSAAALFGFAGPEDLLCSRLRVSDFFVVEEMPIRLAERLSREEALQRVECEMRKMDGSTFWASLTIQSITTPTEGDSLRCRIVDVSDRVHAQAALRTSEARYRSLLEHVSDTVLVIDRTGRVTYASPSAAALLPEAVPGIGPVRAPDAGPAAGPTWLAMVHPHDRQHVHDVIDELQKSTAGTHHAEFRMQRVDGTAVVVSAAFTNLLHDTSVEGIVIHGRDVTAQRRYERELAHLALHDALTGLGNRVLLEEALAHALRQIGRSHRVLAVMFLDLDHFKYINDSLGHAAGDELLRVIAERLHDATRAGDTVARFGGDEFVIVCAIGNPDARGSVTDEVHAIGDRLLAAVSLPVDLSGRSTAVTASIGIELATDAAAIPGELLRNADTALYLAKHRGRNQYAFFNERLRARADQRLALEQELRTALARNEFVLYYQPIVTLDGRQVIGFEALLRWDHERRGLVTPAEFIDVAEETGLIVPIGGWAVLEAIEQLADWQRDERWPSAPYVAVNVSSKQISRPAFVGEIRDALRSTGARPEGLVVEITEHSLLADTDHMQVTLGELHDLGVRLAVDDFGKGYSSLAYLHAFPFDIVKVDRTFVERIDGIGRPDRDLVGAIVAMAHALEMDVIAEGVETVGQLARLEQLRCSAAQGWLFSRPLPVTSIRGVPLIGPD